MSIKSWLRENTMKKMERAIGIVFLCLFAVQGLLATINYSPSQPNAEQPVTFSVTNPNGIAGNQVQWNFGDGTQSLMGPTVITHAFRTKGTYTVRAAYVTNQQQQVADQRTITIVERRAISFTPLRPVVGLPVTFRALNFLSSNIRWDFGDQTTLMGSSVESHIYANPGIYTVTAWDLGGQSTNPITTTVNVVREITGPRAPFRISFLQIRFEDGKTYKVVPKDFEPLMAYADIKYEGTGILRAEWRVDGKVFRIITRSLPFARDIVIDSGDIPGLPTQLPGMHDVTLRIIEPMVEYNIPVIRYFVPLKSVDIPRANVGVLKITSLDGAGLPLVADAIGVPGEGYFLIRGSIQSTNDSTIPFALLRIYLGNDLVDHRLIKNMIPRQDVEFETSIRYMPSGPDRIYILLYDITRKPPDLLVLKRLNIMGASTQ